MRRIISIIFISILIVSCNSLETVTKVNKIDSMLSNNIESGSNLKLSKGTYELDYPIKILGKENITIDGNGATLIMRNMAEDVIYIENSNVDIHQHDYNQVQICTTTDWYISQCTELLVSKCTKLVWYISGMY